jgi:hypothetical protein
MPSWIGERRADLSSVIAGVFFGGLVAIYGPDDEEGSDEEKTL